MGRIDVPIELRLSVYAPIDPDVVRIRKGGGANAVVTVVDGLQEEDLSLDERAGENEMRSKAFDSVDAVIDPAQARDGIFEKILPFVAPAARSDFNDAAG